MKETIKKIIKSFLAIIITGVIISFLSLFLFLLWQIKVELKNIKIQLEGMETNLRNPIDIRINKKSSSSLEMNLPSLKIEDMINY
jgi:hypothetical protein